MESGVTNAVINTQRIVQANLTQPLPYVNDPSQAASLMLNSNTPGKYIVDLNGKSITKLRKSKTSFSYIWQIPLLLPLPVPHVIRGSCQLSVSY